MKLPSLAFFLSMVILTPGCTTRVAHVAPQQVSITPLTLANQIQIKTLATRVTITLDSGYSIMLMGGSRWLHVGSMPNGEVYKPNSGTLETDDTEPREFYIVTSGKQLIGFYLPTERRFTPLKQALFLTFED